MHILTLRSKHSIPRLRQIAKEMRERADERIAAAHEGLQHAEAEAAEMRAAAADYDDWAAEMERLSTRPAALPDAVAVEDGQAPPVWPPAADHADDGTGTHAVPAGWPGNGAQGGA